MLAPVFLLSFFIWGAVSEDDETMALVCTEFQNVTLANQGSSKLCFFFVIVKRLPLMAVDAQCMYYKLPL